MAIETVQSKGASRGLDHRTVWRWHFYAGLFCIPFVALAAVPGTTLDSYQLPSTPASAAEVLVDKGSEQFRVYIHPQTLAVLKDRQRRTCREKLAYTQWAMTDKSVSAFEPETFSRRPTILKALEAPEQGQLAI